MYEIGSTKTQTLEQTHKMLFLFSVNVSPVKLGHPMYNYCKPAVEGIYNNYKALRAAK